MKEAKMSYHVAIIGGGVIGTAIAWKLAHFKLKVLLLEGNPDIAAATTKANGGVIHTGYDPKPGTLMAKLCVAGSKEYPKLSKALGFSMRNTGGLLIGTQEQEEAAIRRKMEYGIKNGVEGLEILRSLEEIQKIEPRVTRQAKSALYIPKTAVVDPFEVSIAFAENAEVNGVKIVRGAQVHKIATQEKGFILTTLQGKSFSASYVVNAAGVFADEVAHMIGDYSFSVDARLGEVLVFDKEGDAGVETVLFPMPGKVSKGIIVIPTVSGNTLVSATARMTNNKKGLENTAKGVEELFVHGQKLVPDINRNLLIRQFAGLRSVLREKEDFLIEPSQANPRFVNVAGIKSPGLASAPAIAELVAELLEQAGLYIEDRKDHIGERAKYVPFHCLSPKEQDCRIQADPDYGKVICRCETITRAEIIDAIRRPVGAITLDGVKRRTRAGMGRCQGGFCQSRVLEILIQELGRQPWEIQQELENSYIISGKVKGGNIE